MKRIGSLVAVLVVTTGGFLAHNALAQPVRREVLKELRIEDVGGCQNITTELQFAVTIQGYSPVHRAALLIVRAIPLQPPQLPPDAQMVREALVPDGDQKTPLHEVSVERDERGGELQLVYQFSENVSYDVTNGKDFRSVIVTLHPDTQDPAPCKNGGTVTP